MSTYGYFRARLLLAPLEPIKDLSQFRLRAVSVVIALCHPLFYWIWTAWFPQPYESVIWRTAACLTAAFTFLLSYVRNLTDTAVEISYVTSIFIGTVLIATWLYLGNQGSAVWTASFCVMVMLHFNLTDWRIALAGTFVSFIVVLVIFPLVEPVIWQQLRASDFIGPPLVVLAFTIGTALFSHFADSNVRVLQLESQMRALAIAAHEVRTPLAGIELLSGAMASRLSDLDAGRPIKSLALDELRALSSDLLQSVHATQAIIATHLANANPFNPFSHRVPISMLEAVTLAVRQFAVSDYARAGMVEVQAPIDFCVHGDAIVMQQVLSNLLENASTAVLKKSEHVQPGCITVTLAINANKGELIVSDTGIGIKRDDMPKVFRPFHTTSAGTGHGLGLTFVQSVVRAYGGEIIIATEVNSGSTFTLRFPTTKPT